MNLVQILRDVERQLNVLVADLEGRQRLIGIHGNRGDGAGTDVVTFAGVTSLGETDFLFA